MKLWSGHHKDKPCSVVAGDNRKGVHAMIKRHFSGLHVGTAKGKLIMADQGCTVVGVRLELKISKASFNRKTYGEIKEFLAEMEQVRGVNYFTILFNDGTGIFFVNCMSACPEYGKIDRDGCIDGFPFGYVTDRGAYFTLTDDQDRLLSSGTAPKGINGLNEVNEQVQLCS